VAQQVGCRQPSGWLATYWVNGEGKAEEEQVRSSLGVTVGQSVAWAD